MQTKQDESTRRSNGAHDEGGARASNELAGAGAPACYQGSVEPFRKPDHKAKRHGRPTAGRPATWAERRARRDRHDREWAL